MSITILIHVLSLCGETSMLDNTIAFSAASLIPFDVIMKCRVKSCTQHICLKRYGIVDHNS